MQREEDREAVQPRVQRAASLPRQGRRPQLRVHDRPLHRRGARVREQGKLKLPTTFLFYVPSEFIGKLSVIV